MKRLLSLIMTAIMCLCMLMALTGCSEPPNNYAGWNGNYQDSMYAKIKLSQTASK